MTDQQLADLLSQHMDWALDYMEENGRPHLAEYLRREPRYRDNWVRRLRNGDSIDVFQIARTRFKRAAHEHNDILESRQKTDSQTFF